MMGSKRAVALAWLLAAGVGSLDLAYAQSGPPAPQQGRASADSAKRAAAPAKSTKPGKSDGKGDAAAAQDNVEAGVKALESGKADAAVASLTSALSASTLPAAQTARALYYRGLAYRRQSKPALAIADLTSALWLKGGLTDQQRQDALQNRAAAYREAGLPDQSEADYARSAASGGSTAPQASATQSASAAVATQSLPAAAPSAAPRPGVGAKAIERTPETSSEIFPMRTALAASAAATPPPAAPAPAPVEASPPQQSQGGGLGGLFGSFGSLFGGGSSTTGSAQPAPSATPTPPAGAQVAGPWSMRTQVASSSPPQTAPSAPPQASTSSPAPALSAGRVAVASLPTAAAPKAAPQAVKPPVVASAPQAGQASGGSYRVQVAAVRSNDEALSIAAMFQDRYARELGNRSAAVDQTVMGNMGTLFRVRIGPFASANESRQMCERLKRDGHDCMVVTQAQ